MPTRYSRLHRNGARSVWPCRIGNSGDQIWHRRMIAENEGALALQMTGALIRDNFRAETVARRCLLEEEAHMWEEMCEEWEMGLDDVVQGGAFWDL